MVRPSLPYQGIARRTKEFLNIPEGVEPWYERDIDVFATIQESPQTEEDSMGIGGYDIIIPTKYSAQKSLSICTEIIKQFWLDCIAEDGSLSPLMHQMFIYKNKEAYESWKKDGGIPENQNSMIDLLAEEGTNELTCVVGDDKEPETALILDIIRKALK